MTAVGASTRGDGPPGSRTPAGQAVQPGSSAEFAPPPGRLPSSPRLPAPSAMPAVAAHHLCAGYPGPSEMDRPPAVRAQALVPLPQPLRDATGAAVAPAHPRLPLHGVPDVSAAHKRRSGRSSARPRSPIRSGLARLRPRWRSGSPHCPRPTAPTGASRPCGQTASQLVEETVPARLLDRSALQHPLRQSPGSSAARPGVGVWSGLHGCPKSCARRVICL
jgi:hypothetical protein